MAFPVIAGIGVLAQGLGTALGAGAQASAANQEAQRRLLQAKEVDNKAIEDERVFREQGREFMGNQVSAYAKGGVTLEGSPLLQLEDTKYKIEQQVASQRRAAAFYSDQLRSGAASQQEQASGLSLGGYIGGFGGVLTGFGSIMAQQDKNTFTAPKKGKY